jgi:hypothetical protein
MFGGVAIHLQEKLGRYRDDIKLYFDGSVGAWLNLMATNSTWLVFMHHAVARVKLDLQRASLKGNRETVV